VGHSTLITDYLGYGLFSARPSSPNVPTGCLATYYATDTATEYGWNGSSWVVIGGGAGAANLGAVLNSGTIQINNSITLTGTAAGTLTIGPGSGTSDVVVNMPASGGTVTLAAAPSFPRQRVEIDIKQGATAGVVNLNSGFVFGTSGGPTGYTITPTANLIDRLMLISPDGTKYAVMAIAQGFTL
jgi:hypothetical protein